MLSKSKRSFACNYGTLIEHRLCVQNLCINYSRLLVSKDDMMGFVEVDVLGEQIILHELDAYSPLNLRFDKK